MRKLLVWGMLQGIFLATAAQIHVANLRCEGLSNPLGVGTIHPRFSWQTEGPGRGLMQTAYELKVGTSNIPDRSGTWKSGKVNSDASMYIPYEGPELLPDRKYFWQVRVWDNQGHVSPWSDVASWQMGLLSPGEWKARWIVPAYTGDSVQRPSPYMRKQFQIDKKIVSATAYVAAHGLYEARINGKRIGDAYLSPGWTSYNKRMPYQAYDVTSMLSRGQNVVGAILGNGWYRGYIGYAWEKNFYGKDIGLLLQLNIRFSDGSSVNIGTDNSWKSSTGSILSAEIYNGEVQDQRLEKQGWDLPGYQDQGWAGVSEADFPKSTLVWAENQPIRKHETFDPVKVITTPNGEKVLDFGQNLVGWVVIRAKGNAGDSVKVSHAEVLDNKGNFYTENLRGAKAQDTYILTGKGVETLEPHFTFHGFRYIRLDQYPGPVDPKDFQAVALYSDMPQTGTFRCSDSLINQLQHNIQWGQKGNFLDVPTDCPQRDERLGWTGDAEVFSRTATFNMDVYAFFRKWLRDVSADQLPSGILPCVIPNVVDCEFGSAGWADASTIVPWNMYLAYGDTQILSDQYASMKAWVEYMHKSSPNDLWNTGPHFGDWLFYSPWDDNSGRAAVTDKYLIAQCFYAHSTQLLVDAAHVLGKEDDAERYGALLQRIRNAFQKEYVTPNGRLVSSTQTAYVLALQFDMLPESLRQQAAERLVANIRDYDNHLTTGFLGASFLCPVLSRYGYTDVAYKLLFQQTYPSWLYPVSKGATTIWERWDGIRADGTLEVPSMNSFNHYAYGAIGDWMYRSVTGIDTYTDAPGYKHILIKPHPGGPLTSASANYQTNYGNIVSEWMFNKGDLYLQISIPVNTHATIYIPARSGSTVTEGGNPLQAAQGITVSGAEDGYVVAEAGSGNYVFRVQP